MEIKTVLIGIQARSTSKRFPGKCNEILGDKRVLDHVIDAARSAASYINRHTTTRGVLAIVKLLIPFGDDIESSFKGKCHIIQGPEEDVLTRYKIAADSTEADYIVRITGDCPRIPPYLISKHITLALMNEYDYISNSDEASRTSLDGIDCEVMSRRMLNYIDEASTSQSDREHVTPMARREPPSWAKCGTVVGFFDQSSIKLSVDTKEDLETVRAEYESLNKRVANAEKKYGKQFVHRV